MTSLLWESAVVVQYAVTALLSGFNASYLLSRHWATRRLRVGAWTLALVSLGVAVQGLSVALTVLGPGRPGEAEARGWLLAGSLGLAGSLLVMLLLLRSRRPPGRG